MVAALGDVDSHLWVMRHFLRLKGERVNGFGENNNNNKEAKSKTPGQETELGEVRVALLPSGEGLGHTC